MWGGQRTILRLNSGHQICWAQQCLPAELSWRSCCLVFLVGVGKEGGARMHACMHMYTHHMCGRALRGQRKSWLYVTVSPLVWVLGMELGSWARAADTLSGKAIVFQALTLCVSVPKSCLAYCVLGQLWGMFLCRSKLPFSFPEPGASDNLAPLHPV